MLIIIDGEDTAASRLKLNELIDRNADVIRIDGKKQNTSDIENSVAGNGLFSEKKTVVIENYTKIKPQPKLFEVLAPYIQDKSTTILLWDTLVSRGKSVGAKGILHYTFDFPKLFYTFLDSIAPNRQKQNIEMMHKVLLTNTPEQLFFSLSKRARHLMYIKSGNYESFAEFAKMAPWQIGKLKKQADMWDEGSLKSFVKAVADTDEQIKTSALSLPLAKHLDILIASA